jgi:hypothetical protein
VLKIRNKNALAEHIIMNFNVIAHLKASFSEQLPV